MARALSCLTSCCSVQYIDSYHRVSCTLSDSLCMHALTKQHLRWSPRCAWRGCRVERTPTCTPPPCTPEAAHCSASKAAEGSPPVDPGAC